MTLNWKIISTLVFAVGIVFFLPFIGGEALSPSALWDFAGEAQGIDHRILVDLRLPRLGLVLITGGALAILGASYQILFHNPLAEPYVLGISSAVTLGAVLSEVFLKLAAESPFAPLLGFLAALLVTTLLLYSYHSKLGGNLEKVILFGMGINFVLSSVLFLILSYHAQSMGGGALRWLFGAIPWINLKDLLIYAVLVLPFVIFLLLFSRPLDALSLGDSVSRSMGYNPKKTRGLILLLSSICLAIIATRTGAIGFVGLVIPHSVRLIYRPHSTRSLFLLSFLIGGVFLGLSDCLSRAILPPFEFPVGIITTIIGGPLFLALLWKR